MKLWARVPRLEGVRAEVCGGDLRTYQGEGLGCREPQGWKELGCRKWALGCPTRNSEKLTLDEPLNVPIPHLRSLLVVLPPWKSTESACLCFSRPLAAAQIDCILI